jgi:Ca2+-binding RTX toxin-like protein
MIVLLTASDARFGGTAAAAYHYDLTMSDGNLAPGGLMYISANTLLANESLRLDASAETSGRYVVFTGEGADRIIGGGGTDELSGRGGSDVIAGGGGADLLRGGVGGDLFTYLAAADSASGGVDQILDFGAGDRIDLAAIDANSQVGGEDAFQFIGSAAFTAAGQLRAVASGNQWTVEADVNGDGIADFTLLVTVTDPLVTIDADSFVR